MAKEIAQNVSEAIETECKSQATETKRAGLQRVTPGLRPAARCIRKETAKEIAIFFRCDMFLCTDHGPLNPKKA